MNPSPLDAQVNRASRRLFLQTLVHRLAWCWTGALAVGVLWFLVQPFLVQGADPALRWIVTGVAFALSTGLATWLAWRSAPSRLAAALAIDERFGLKERVTTSLTLTPQQRSTAAGTALMEDALQRVAPLDVPSQFPVRLSWVGSLVPLTAALLILAALFYDPTITPEANGASRSKQPPANAAEIEQAREKLKETPRDKALPPDAKSDQLKDIEADIAKLANRPFDTREDARERLKEMEAAENKVKERLKELEEEKKATRELLQELNKNAEKHKEGPANDVQKALAEGDLARAQKEMEKLAEEVREDKLSDKQKEELQKQLDELKDESDKIAKKKQEEKSKEQREQEEKLEKLIEEAKKDGRDTEALERELSQMRQEEVSVQQLKELTEKLAECKECMNKGDKESAADKLQEAAIMAKKMGKSDKEVQALQDQLSRLKDARSACAKDTNSGDGKKGDGNGQAKGQSGPSGKGGDGKNEGDGRGQGQQAGGRRPKGTEGDTTSVDAREKNNFDPNKSMLPTGFAPGKNFKAKTDPEIAGEIKQASQAAPEAIEQQRIPKAKRDIAKDYYRNLGEQAEKKP